MNVKEDIELASQKAREAGLKVEEVFLGPKQVQELGGEITTKDEKEYYGDLVVRRLAKDGTRVGATSCRFGPGVT